MGSKFGGWSFYLDQGRPVAYASVSGLPLPGAQSRIAADAALQPGAHNVVFDFDATTPLGGTLTVTVDGETVASGEVAQRPRMVAGNGETFDTGRDSNVPVSPDYQREGVFSGALDKVTVKLKMPGTGSGNQAKP